jgi:hypothetical protein
VWSGVALEIAIAGGGTQTPQTVAATVTLTAAQSKRVGKTLAIGGTGRPEIGVYPDYNRVRFTNAIEAAGGTVTWVRIYPQPATTVSAATIASNIQTYADLGLKSYVSFKSQYTWEQVASGSDDARWTAIGNAIADITPAGAWCFNHEPENDRATYGSSANGAAFVAAFDHIAGIIKPLAPNWIVSPCLFDEVFPQYLVEYPGGRGANWASAGDVDPDDWIPTSTEMLGFDYYDYRNARDGGVAGETYHWATTDDHRDSTAAITEALTYADARNVPLCFPEFGAFIRDPDLDPTDEINRTNWLQQVADDWSGDQRIVFVAYFEVNDQNDGVKANYAITDDDHPAMDAGTVAAFAAIQGEGSFVAAALVKSALKPLSVALTATAAIARRTLKNVAGTITAAAVLTIANVKLQAIAAATTVTAALTRRTNKLVALAVSAAAALTRSVLKPLAATVTATAALVRSTLKNVPATVTAAAVMTRIKVKVLTLAATTSVAAALTRQTNKLVALAVSVAAALVRQTRKPIAATVSVAAALTKNVVKAVQNVAVSIAAALTPVKNAGGTQFDRTVDLAVSMTAAVTKNVLKPMAATLTATAALVRWTAKTLPATVTLTAARTSAKVKVQLIAATVTVTAALTRLNTRTVALALSFAADLTRVTKKVMAATLTMTAAISRVTRKLVPATTTVTAALTRIKVKVLTLAASTTVTAALTRQTKKAVAATLTITAALLRRIPQRIAASLTMAAAVVKNVSKLVPATLTAAAAMTRGKVWGKAVPATVTMTAAMTRIRGKLLAVGVSVAAALTRQTNKVVALTVDMGAAFTKHITVTLEAAVSVVVNNVVEFIVAGFRSGLGGIYRAVIGLRGRSKSQTVDLSAVYKPALRFKGKSSADQ